MSGFEPVSSVPLKHFFYRWSCTPLSYCLHFITLFKVLVNVAKVEKTVTVAQEITEFPDLKRVRLQPIPIPSEDRVSRSDGSVLAYL